MGAAQSCTGGETVSKIVELPDALAQMLDEIAREENVGIEDLVSRLLQEALVAESGGPSRRRGGNAHCFADTREEFRRLPDDRTGGRNRNPSLCTLLESGFLDDDDDATVH